MLASGLVQHHNPYNFLLLYKTFSDQVRFISIFFKIQTDSKHLYSNKQRQEKQRHCGKVLQNLKSVI